MVHGYVPTHNAGAELTIHAMLRHLTGLGSAVDVLLSRPHPDVVDASVVDGVRVHPYLNNGDPIRFIEGPNRPDVIIAHLENQPRACALGDVYGIPVVHVLHNTHDFSKHCLRRGPAALAAFNTVWMAKDYEAWLLNQGIDPLPFPRLVVRPAVHPEDYATTPGKAITLINLWDGKGGELFWRLAKRLPNRQFLGVLGAYGEQVIHADRPNVELVAHQSPAQMRDNVYGRTRVLLMPSDYESYGRTSIEAACSGIPTIAHPTPGLLEALGDAGTFVDRNDVDGWVAALSRLNTPKGWALASRKAKARAAELTPTADLDRFADAMEGVTRRGLARVG